MIAKFSVKKPYTVLVGVILVIVLGVVSFMRMTTDLLPNISLPYVIIMTPYPGASPDADNKFHILHIWNPEAVLLHYIKNILRRWFQGQRPIMLSYALLFCAFLHDRLILARSIPCQSRLS